MSAFKLKKDVLKGSNESKGKGILCLDFGTAMCKAVASKGSADFVALSLGRRAKDPSAANQFMLPSSIFISPRGHVFFGHEAISESLKQDDFSVARIDSLKQWLGGSSGKDLGIPLGKDQNPTDVPFSRGDALVSLLAYFSDIASTELVEKHSAPRYMRRRFTRPVWDDQLLARDREVHRCFCTSQLVADTLSGLWEDGIPISVLREVLDQAYEESSPDFLFEKQGVPEPIAAGVSRLAREDQHRSIALVVDIGAGTTDQAAMAVIQRDGSSAISRAVIQGAPTSKWVAGDYLDEQLKKAIHEVTKVPANRDKEIEIELMQSIRRWKEDLFRDGYVAPQFSGGMVSGRIELKAFLGRPSVIKFSNELSEQLMAILKSISRAIDLFSQAPIHKLDRVSLVPSGGGARLWIMDQLTKEAQKHLGRTPVINVGCDPSWFRTQFRSTPDLYPQLAVAIGGAAPELPDMPGTRSPIVRRGRI